MAATAHVTIDAAIWQEAVPDDVAPAMVSAPATGSDNTTFDAASGP